MKTFKIPFHFKKIGIKTPLDINLNTLFYNFGIGEENK